MENKRDVWENGNWRVTARVFFNEIKGEKHFNSDVTVSKFDKKTGRFELNSSVTKLPKIVESACTNAHEFIRKSHFEYIEGLRKNSDNPFIILQKEDAITIEMNDGSTGKVFYREQDETSITILNFTLDEEQVILKSEIEELYHLDLKMMVYPVGEVDRMLALYDKQLEDILSTVAGKKKTMLLANLMTQMENHYQLPMNKDRFEKEVPPAVKELYLEVSQAREL